MISSFHPHDLPLVRQDYFFIHTRGDKKMKLQKRSSMINDDIGITTGNCNTGALAVFLGVILLFIVSLLTYTGGI